jgi:peptide deformylase
MPKLMDIKIYPQDKNLRKKSLPISPKVLQTENFLEFIKNMKYTMKEKDGIGLAAPQIGKNIRLIIVSTKNGEITMINPEIIRKSWTKEIGEEGCLSVPEVFCEVKRHKNIICSFINENGETVKIKAAGLFARVIQHETDHLDGILFIDKAEKKNKKNIF